MKLETQKEFFDAILHASKESEENEKIILEIYNKLLTFVDINNFPHIIFKDMVNSKEKIKELENKYSFNKDLCYCEVSRHGRKTEDLYYYYFDPYNKKIYYNIQEIKNNAPRPYNIYRGDITCNSILEQETFYRYIKEYDVIAKYTFGIKNEDNFYVPESIQLYLRKDTVLKSYSGNEVCEFKNRNIKFEFYTKIAEDNTCRKALQMIFYYNSNFCYGITKLFHGPFGSAEPLAKALYEMYGTLSFNSGANNNCSILNHYGTFCASNNTPPKISVKNQKKIKELTDIKLPEINVYKIRKYLAKRYSNLNVHGSFLLQTVAINHVKENISVIRWISFDLIRNTQQDMLRIYVEDKEITACKRYADGKFHYYKISELNLNNFKSDLMLDVKEEDVEGTCLRYYWKILNDLPQEKRSLALLTFLEQPKLEQLAKIGCPSIVISILDGLSGNKKAINKEIKRRFDFDWENADIFKATGFNRHQLLKIEALTSELCSSSICNTITSLKRNFDTKQLCDIDDETFDAVATCISNVKGYSSELNSICYFLKEKNPTLLKNFFKQMVPVFNQHSAITHDFRDTTRNLRIYSDYLRMIDQMDLFNDFKLNFKTIEEIQSAHNEIMVMFEYKQNQELEENFKENLKKVEKVTYKSKNFDFEVIIPQKPEDVAREGVELSHCVKSYIPSIAEGKTNIVFIRKKDNLEKPFFTVELSNEMDIVQVHGFGNRNANTEKGLTEFVEKWADAKKLKICNVNQILGPGHI